jgi:hypothetical protein
VFLHQVGSAGHVVYSGLSRPRNVDALFLMLRWARCGFHKKHAGTRYVELVFLNLVRFALHIVHSSALGVQNIVTLFFILGWDDTDSTKSTAGHIMPKLCFLIWLDLWVT